MSMSTIGQEIYRRIVNLKEMKLVI